MSGNDWNLPDFALRQLREARRKRREVQTSARRAAYHLKRAAGQMMVLERSLTGWAPVSEEILNCTVILNDLNSRGTRIFLDRPMTIGTCVSFSLMGFGGFHARARVVESSLMPTTGKIIGVSGSLRYRIRLAFEFETSDDVYAINEFTLGLREKLVAST